MSDTTKVTDMTVGDLRTLLSQGALLHIHVGKSDEVELLSVPTSVAMPPPSSPPVIEQTVADEPEEKAEPGPEPEPGIESVAPPQEFEWPPEWADGEEIDMPQGTGEGIGVTKRFSYLIGHRMTINRPNGMKRRQTPDKGMSYGENLPHNSEVILTGLLNLNREHNWRFAKVLIDQETDHEEQFWLGGDRNSEIDPYKCLKPA